MARQRLRERHQDELRRKLFKLKQEVLTGVRISNLELKYNCSILIVYVHDIILSVWDIVSQVSIVILFMLILANIPHIPCLCVC